MAMGRNLNIKGGGAHTAVCRQSGKVLLHIDNRLAHASLEEKAELTCSHGPFKDQDQHRYQLGPSPSMQGLGAFEAHIAT
jgi:hypothetical protein